MYNRFTSKLFNLLCTLLSTLVLIVYPLHVVLDDPANASSTTSSISPKEAWTAAILGSKHRCQNVFDLNLYGYIWCDVLYECDVMNIVIPYGFPCLNLCVGFGCIYGCTVYYVNLLCRFCNSSCAGYTIFCNFF
jgi:hypothetical protein